MSGPIVDYQDGEVRVHCPATAARCRCRHDPGHKPPHECEDTETCNGAWLGSDADGGDVEAVRYPFADGLGPLADLLFGAGMPDFMFGQGPRPKQRWAPPPSGLPDGGGGR